MLRNLAVVCYRNPRRTLLSWLLVLVVLGSGVGFIKAAPSSGVELPRSESQRAFEILQKASPSQAGVAGRVVFHAASSEELLRAKSDIQALLSSIETIGSVAVSSPFATSGASQISRDGKTAFASLSILSEVRPGEKSPTASKIEAVVSSNPLQGVQVELGGEPFVTVEAPQSEVLGIAAAIFVLLLSFGSLLAVGLPISVGILGVSSGAMLLTLSSHLVSMPSFAVTLAVMIGLGVGIDYSLFILARYAEEATRRETDEEAAVTAVSTAGRSVIFAALVVVASLLGMTLMGVSFVTGLAVGAAIAVVTTLAATLTATPALIALLGPRFRSTTKRTVIATTMFNVALIAVAVHQMMAGLVVFVLTVVFVLVTRSYPLFRSPALTKRGLAETNASFRRWGTAVQRRPLLSTAGGLLILLVLALPTLSMRLGSSDNGSLPESQTARRAYDILSESFSPGFNGPLLLVAEAPPSATSDSYSEVENLVRSTPGVAFVSPAQFLPGSRVVMWQAIPLSGPQDEATSKLIRTLREDVLPKSDIPVLVGGPTAAYDDFASYLAGRLFMFMAAVLLVSFLLLVAVFRSLLVPLKAVLLNLMSIAAAYGVVVAVFQWGWGASLIGVGKPGPVEAFAPMMLFAIVFGLSMDYEVFLLSRIREEYDTLKDSSRAVTEGLTHTARVITSAAAIMVAVFGSFVLEDTRQVKLFGVGLAVAVLLDATVVRLILVPSTMELLGSKNWWIPRWLGRLIPEVRLENHQAPETSHPEDIGTRTD